MDEEEDWETAHEITQAMMVKSLTMSPEQIAEHRAQVRWEDPPELMAELLDIEMRAVKRHLTPLMESKDVDLWGVESESLVESYLSQLADPDEESDVDLWNLGGEALLVELRTEDPVQQARARQIREGCRDILQTVGY